MIPVEQTILRVEDGANCMAAGLASILEVPLDAVPNAALEWRKGRTASLERGWELLHVWLGNLGLSIVSYGAEEELEGWRPSGYWLAGIDSPRFPGESHIVVARGGRVVWDPHPDVTDPDPWPAIRFCYALIADDPARLARELPLHSPSVVEAIRPYLRPEAPPPPYETCPPDDALVAAVVGGARLTREITDRLGGDVYAVSHAMRRLVREGRLQRVGYLSDYTTAVWGTPDAADCRAD